MVVVLLAMLSISTILNAQNVLLEKSYGDPAINTGTSILKHQMGGYIIGGNKDGGAINGTDIMIIRTNAFGAYPIDQLHLAA